MMRVDQLWRVHRVISDLPDGVFENLEQPELQEVLYELYVQAEIELSDARREHANLSERAFHVMLDKLRKLGTSREEALLCLSERMLLV